MTRLRRGGARRPDEREELLLIVAFGRDDDALNSWDRLRPHLDLDVLELGAQALLPLVDRRLERLGIDDPDSARLRGIRRRTWYLNQLLIDRLAPVLHAVQSSGARPLLVGSWELALHYYADLGVRRLAGLHALVDHRRAAAAVDSITALGWDAPRSATAHRIRFVGPDGDECVLYLRLFRDFPVAGAPVARGVEEVHVAGRRYQAVSPTNDIARICHDDAGGPSPIWVADALSILGAQAIDWEELLHSARVARGTSRLHDVCAYLRTRFGCPIPTEFLSELALSQTLRRERLAERLDGIAPRTATTFLRATSAAPFARALVSLPRFLQCEWGVTDAMDLPGMALRKLRARLRRARSTSPVRDRAA